MLVARPCCRCPTPLGVQEDASIAQYDGLDGATHDATSASVELETGPSWCDHFQKAILPEHARFRGIWGGGHRQLAAGSVPLDFGMERSPICPATGSDVSWGHYE